ncbi:MAG: hypothetical protein MJE68_28395 [Proteobacteria bacterium]|nr:hypothetical protein [Pseudomonadota bacterium]
MKDKNYVSFLSLSLSFLPSLPPSRWSNVCPCDLLYRQASLQFVLQLLEVNPLDLHVPGKWVGAAEVSGKGHQQVEYLNNLLGMDT